ncbi:hypothetical protein [Streptomyces sp. H27-D2]|uniref:hypothetical protein n=1 Tax=Streptomyces sp. H27-D2 TaxID=3046304 RepID=UPI002DBAC639|nr:hypothetical protein [Streptomyces sp. H27-D2]MEC4016204.1 hypothetical protein [Streptomyces sp. H27-D2]
MLAQSFQSPVIAPDRAALGAAMVEPETSLSDAPVNSPQAWGVGFLLLGLLLSPKEPKDK